MLNLIITLILFALVLPFIVLYFIFHFIEQFTINIMEYITKITDELPILLRIIPAFIGTALIFPTALVSLLKAISLFIIKIFIKDFKEFSTWKKTV